MRSLVWCNIWRPTQLLLLLLLIHNGCIEATTKLIRKAHVNFIDGELMEGGSEPSWGERLLKPAPKHHKAAWTDGEYQGCLNYSESNLNSKWKFSGKPPGCHFHHHGGSGSGGSSGSSGGSSGSSSGGGGSSSSGGGS
eukprot:CAMPEP_0194247324 /NCGR_PEP_ID=MMETSP0158-20130606/16397_1 /TAXON_ID=33649 /ORGANISM="Thalassionema nitzschioides, Strain L26-B" /LENGTH=137 /DNA_ID=CAMNT_0038983401 /DNA_START=57 /DNA_END=467 /DNA_ORIENTATION=-